MTWAEFLIRSSGFKRLRRWEMQLTREIAYEVHVGHYMWGKRKPPKKDVYWPLEGKKGNVSEELIAKLRKERAEFKKIKDGKA